MLFAFSSATNMVSPCLLSLLLWCFLLPSFFSALFFFFFPLFSLTLLFHLLGAHIPGKVPRKILLPTYHVPAPLFYVGRSSIFEARAICLIPKKKTGFLQFSEGQWPQFCITLKGKCNPSYSINIWKFSPIYQLLLKLRLSSPIGSNFPQIPYAGYFFLVASESTSAFYNLKQMHTAHNVGKERWRQRRLTMHAFKRCENASGKNMTLSVELVRGGLRHIMY